MTAPRGMEHIAQHLDGLAKARKDSDEELDRAIGNIRLAYGHVCKAAVDVTALNGEKARSDGALSELAEYLENAREVLAEVTLVLLDLHPTKRNLLANQGQNMSVQKLVETDAKNGIVAKRLAAWEEQARRTVVVEALAGKSKKPT